MEFPKRGISRLWSSEITDCALRCINTNVTQKPAASIIGPPCPKTEASSPLVDLLLIYQMREFKPLEYSDKDYMYSSPLAQEFGTATSLRHSEKLKFVYPVLFGLLTFRFLTIKKLC